MTDHSGPTQPKTGEFTLVRESSDWAIKGDDAVVRGVQEQLLAAGGVRRADRTDLDQLELKVTPHHRNTYQEVAIPGPLPMQCATPASHATQVALAEFGQNGPAAGQPDATKQFL